MKTSFKNQTLNFHLTKSCNYRCKFCFVTFKELKEKSLSKEEHIKIIDMLYESKKFDKINFTGREPTLVKHLPQLVQYAKNLGFKTGMISNASLLSEDYLNKLTPFLDNLIISIDSFNKETNHLIGRFDKNGMVSFEQQLKISEYCYKNNIRLKINTVANRYNILETLTNKINKLAPKRWKIQQVTKIEGQNDEQFNEFKISEQEFHDFVKRNQEGLSSKIKFSVYDESKVKNSYLLMDPLGRFYTDIDGKHTYSNSILNKDLESALSEIIKVN